MQPSKLQLVPRLKLRRKSRRNLRQLKERKSRKKSERRLKLKQSPGSRQKPKRSEKLRLRQLLEPGWLKRALKQRPQLRRWRRREPGWSSSLLKTTSSLIQVQASTLRTTTATRAPKSHPLHPNSLRNSNGSSQWRSDSHRPSARSNLWSTRKLM